MGNIRYQRTAPQDHLGGELPPLEAVAPIHLPPPRPIQPGSIYRESRHRLSSQRNPNGRLQRFRSMKTLQKFSSIHAQVHNQFNQERHLITRQVYKQRRSIALTEVARPCRVRRRLRASVSRYASANAVTLTTPFKSLRRHLGGSA